MKATPTSTLLKLKALVDRLCITQDGKYQQVVPDDNYPPRALLVMGAFTAIELCEEIGLILLTEDDT